MKDSGEYCQRTFVPDSSDSAYFWQLCAPRTAMSLIPALSRPKTTRRCRVEVEL